MRLVIKLTASLALLMPLAAVAPVEAADMTLDINAAWVRYRATEDMQKHPKKAGVALTQGDARFVDRTFYTVCASYHRSDVGDVDKGKFKVVVDLVTPEGIRTIATVKKVRVRDNSGFECVEIDPVALRIGDVILLRFTLKKMPRMPQREWFEVKGTLWPS